MPVHSTNDLSDMKFPLGDNPDTKMIAEAKKNKWTNPTTGNLYKPNTQLMKHESKSLDINQLLDAKFKVDAGFGVKAKFK